MKEKIKGILFWLVLFLVLVGCNRLLSTPNVSMDYLPEDVQEEINEEARQDFIEEQLF